MLKEHYFFNKTRILNLQFTTCSVKSIHKFHISMFKGNGSTMKEDTFAQRDIFAQRNFCTKTLLHEGSFLHESFKRKLKNNKYKKK